MLDNGRQLAEGLQLSVANGRKRRTWMQMLEGMQSWRAVSVAALVDEVVSMVLICGKNLTMQAMRSARVLVI